MRLPFLLNPKNLIAAWRQLVVQYERDYEALSPSIEDITLTTSTTFTVINNFKIRPTSGIYLIPKTANASAEYGAGTIYIDTPTDGEVSIHHASDGNTDKIYRMLVTGD